MNCFNSLAPGRSECYSKNVIFILVLLIGIFRSSHDNTLRWMPEDLTDDKSTLVLVMAWCRQATSHYLSQCWLSSLSPYGVARPQWVKDYKDILVCVLTQEQQYMLLVVHSQCNACWCSGDFTVSQGISRYGTVDSRYLAPVGSQNLRARIKWFSRYLALSREGHDSRLPGSQTHIHDIFWRLQISKQ